MERARGEGYVYQKIEFLLMYTCGYKSYCVRKGQRVITLALFHEILLAISIRVSNEAMPPTVTNKHQHKVKISSSSGTQRVPTALSNTWYARTTIRYTCRRWGG